MKDAMDLEMEEAVVDLMEAVRDVILNEPELEDVAELFVSLPQAARNEMLRNLVMLQIEQEVTRFGS